MKKYITTDKHAEFKEGIILEKEYIDALGGKQETKYFISPLQFVRLHSSTIKRFLQKGYIKELQEPEFTRNDMEKAFEAGRRMEESPLIYTYGCAEDYLDTLNKDTNEETEHKK